MIAQTYCDKCGDDTVPLRISPASNQLLCYGCWDIFPPPPLEVFNDKSYTFDYTRPKEEKER